MAKHKKTRREKKVADKRHTLYHLETSTAQEAIKVNEKEVISTYKPKAQSSTGVVNLDYVKNDVRKILIVSSIIFTSQIVIYFLLNRV